jgi:hypothetical protein
MAAGCAAALRDSPPSIVSPFADSRLGSFSFFKVASAGLLVFSELDGLRSNSSSLRIDSARPTSSCSLFASPFARSCSGCSFDCAAAAGASALGDTNAAATIANRHENGAADGEPATLRVLVEANINPSRCDASSNRLVPGGRRANRRINYNLKSSALQPGNGLSLGNVAGFR